MLGDTPVLDGSASRARALTKSYGDFQAVRGIAIDVRKGEAFGFLGPNGAGKSSTMRMVAALLPVTSSKLSILGLDPATDGPAIRGRIGVGPQDDMLEFVHMTGKAKSKIDDLSGGMKRRLATARSLVKSPEMLLLDEPTTGLDPQARRVVWDQLFRLKLTGVTIWSA